VSGKDQGRRYAGGWESTKEKLRMRVRTLCIRVEDTGLGLYIGMGSTHDAMDER